MIIKEKVKVSLLLKIRYSADEFTLTNKEIDYMTLKMFARFPAGIPEEIDISDIR